LVRYGKTSLSWRIITKKKFCTTKIAEKNLAKGAMGNEIEQVLSAIIISIVDVNKNLAQAIAYEKNMHNLRVRTKFMPQKTA